MKYSVIVPCYNVISYLSKCLDSIFGAYELWKAEEKTKEKKLEVLLINDGSSDEFGGGIGIFWTF